MKEFWRSKLFWGIALTLFGIGLFIYLTSKPETPSDIYEKELIEEIKKDTFPPSTAIVSPRNNLWFNDDFKVNILDSDLGSGLVPFKINKSGCHYLVTDLGTGKSSGGFRPCKEAEVIIEVGLEKVCSSSYSKDNLSSGKCKVSSKSFDLAGNDSGWKSSTFNIDLIPPVLTKIESEQIIKAGQEYFFKTTVSDNKQLSNCWFYINNVPINNVADISPRPCKDNESCTASVVYKIEEEGSFELRFGCNDFAGNTGFSEPFTVGATTNHPPKISFCRVGPTKGFLETEFKFEAEVTDPDNDSFSYVWDFGDNRASTEKNPIHVYEKIGLFKPKLFVSDEKGAKVECSTAWVVVNN